MGARSAPAWLAGALLGAGAIAALSWLAWQPGGERSVPGELASAALPAVVAPLLQRPAATASQESAPITAGFVLLEVGTSARSGRDVAVMRVDGGPPARFGVGDSVAVGVRLAGILPTHVELQRGARVERVMLTRSDPLNSQAPPLRPLRVMRHGAAAADAAAAAPPPDVITRRVDSAPPSSAAIDRAIARASAHASPHADARAPER